MCEAEGCGPIGRFDHIGIAVYSIERARGFFEGVLGAKLRRTSVDRSGDFKVGIFDLHNFCIELLEPVNPNGFLAKFLAKRGEGVHHITIQTPELKKKIIAMEEKGVRVVDKHLHDPDFLDAFISPNSAHGILIQLGQTSGPLNNPPYWQDQEDES
ncbi:MAG: methylmalonyl-CoA epimerase [Gammaproteobacteria bacterium]|nr:methylmalonyl-CoA epimerase [Gammaproteobacteria bacterium]